MSKLSPDQQQLHINSYRKLIKAQQTLILSTVTDQGEPEVSYAPYIRDTEGVFYIYVSELASHTHHLLNQGRASLMIIASEQSTKNMFARERVIFQCRADEIQKTEVLYKIQLDLMEQQLGETVGLLRRLSDFHLLALVVESGRYIAGFGQAFSINIQNDTLQFDDIKI